MKAKPKKPKAAVQSAPVSTLAITKSKRDWEEFFARIEAMKGGAK